MALPKQSRRHRTPSDPFSDPAPTVSYSSYGVPTLAKTATQSHRPPPPPPKQPQSATNRHQSTTMSSKDNAAEAIQEVVQVRRVDQNGRTRMGRSQTQAPAPASSSRPVVPPSRRSLSQDSGAPHNVAEKAKGNARRPPIKKGSSHADVIDRLDFSGVGPMFHHDGPFDACAPSRNRHRAKAPMFAWSTENAEDKDAFAQAREIPSSSYASPYPSPGLYVPYEAPQKKRDAIAEAWGIHEPEPFEDFSAGGGYTAHSADYGTVAPASRNGNGNGSTARRPKDAREARDKYKDYLNEGQTRRQQTKRTALPPPQPIFVPEGELDNGLPTPSPPSSPGAPKRSRSIMNRIRKMRDAPNVPVGSDDYANGYDRDPSPTSSAENSAATTSQVHGQGATFRPKHRSQNSFLGRLGRAANGAKEGNSPTSDTSDNFVYVENHNEKRNGLNKSLPATPAKSDSSPGVEYAGGYFEQTSPGATGLGRRASLMKKVKGVVKGVK